MRWYILIFQCSDESMPALIVRTSLTPNKSLGKIIQEQAEQNYFLVSMTAVQSSGHPRISE